MIKPARTWRAWLVYDRERAEKNADYIRMHKQIGRTFGFDFELKMIEETGLDISRLPDFALFVRKYLFPVPVQPLSLAPCHAL